MGAENEWSFCVELRGTRFVLLQDILFLSEVHYLPMFYDKKLCHYFHGIPVRNQFDFPTAKCETDQKQLVSSENGTFREYFMTFTLFHCLGGLVLLISSDSQIRKLCSKQLRIPKL